MKLSHLSLETFSMLDLDQAMSYQDFIKNHREHPMSIAMSKHSLSMSCSKCLDTLISWPGSYMPNMLLLIETENEDSH